MHPTDLPRKNESLQSGLSAFLRVAQRRADAMRSDAAASLRGADPSERKNLLDLNVVVGVDISGSISHEMYAEMMRALRAIRGASRMKVIEVDDDVRAMYDLSSWETRPKSVVRLTKTGGNGENILMPLVRRIRPDAFLYMTDGHVVPADNPGVPTGWILTAAGVRPYSWGEVVGRLSR